MSKVVCLVCLWVQLLSYVVIARYFSIQLTYKYKKANNLHIWYILTYYTI